MKDLYATTGPTFGDPRERLRDPLAFVTYLDDQFDGKAQQVFGRSDVFRVGGMLNMSFPEMEDAGMLVIEQYRSDNDHLEPVYILDRKKVVDALMARIASPDAAARPR